MITPSTVYWITRLDEVRDFVNRLGFMPCMIVMFGTVAAIVLFVLSVATGNGYCEVFEGKSDDALAAIHETMKRISKTLLKIVLVCILIVSSLHAIVAFTPTTKEMAAIIVIPKIANSESVQQLGDGIVDLAKQWLKELAPKKEPTE